MKYILENRKIDGKYQYWWFKWFDFLCKMGILIELGDNLEITNFNIDFKKLKKNSGSYLFSIAVKEISEKNVVLSVDKDGTITYGA